MTVELAGRKVAVTAEELHGAERTEAWKKITTEAAGFRNHPPRPPGSRVPP